MADRFWVGNGGNWSDNANHWSATSDGAPNASKPTSADNVYFDDQSFDAADQTVTVDEDSYCLAMDWTGATNTPTLAFTITINYYGSITFIAAMAISGTGKFYCRAVTDITITTAGLTLTARNRKLGTGKLTLQDAFTSDNVTYYGIDVGELDTNNQTVTISGFYLDGDVAKTLTLGSSVINSTAYGFRYEATNTTLDAGTSTYKITGTGDIISEDFTLYNVELNGTAHTISGSNTFSTLTFKDATTQTITFTDGTTQTAGTFVITGESGKVKTLTGTGAAGWIITKTGGGYVDCDYMTIDYSTAKPEDTFYAGGNSTNGGNNTNWLWTSYANRAMRGAGWWLLSR